MKQLGIRVGLVGAGYWGPQLIRNCVELGVLYVVCDTDAAALESVRSTYPTVTTTHDFEAMLAAPIDAVIIATPAQLHKEMCLKAVKAHKHVFVEKPLALGVDDGIQIVAAAEEAGVNVFVGHLLLHHPAVKKLRVLIQEGAIGDVWHLRSRRLSLGKLRSHENVWWSFAPHDIALMLAIMGEEPTSVISAQSGAGTTQLSDVAYADFEFSAARSAHIEVCWLDPTKSARLDVFGTRGVLTLEDSRRGSTLTLKPFEIARNDRGDPIPVRGAEQNVDFEATEPLRAEIEEFLESIRSGKPAETDAKQGVAVLRSLTRADEAVQRRLPLKAVV